MSASATSTTLFTFRLDRRQLVRRVRVDVTGLASGANTIPHGIVAPNNQAAGQTPKEEIVLLTSNVAVHRTQAADATNLYYTVDSGTGTTISVYVTV
jgi:hypothetical protein